MGYTVYTSPDGARGIQNQLRYISGTRLSKAKCSCYLGFFLFRWVIAVHDKRINIKCIFSRYYGCWDAQRVLPILSFRSKHIDRPKMVLLRANIGFSGTINKCLVLSSRTTDCHPLCQTIATRGLKSYRRCLYCKKKAWQQRRYISLCTGSIFESLKLCSTNIHPEKMSSWAALRLPSRQAYWLRAGRFQVVLFEGWKVPCTHAISCLSWYIVTSIVYKHY